MTKKSLEYPRDNTMFDPFRHLLKIRTWGTKWKKVINKIVEWAIGKCEHGQRESFYNETKCEHFQG